MAVQGMIQKDVLASDRLLFHNRYLPLCPDSLLYRSSGVMTKPSVLVCTRRKRTGQRPEELVAEALSCLWKS